MNAKLNKIQKAIETFELVERIRDRDGDRDLVTSPKAIESEWGFLVSVETSNGYLLADYYGEFRGGFPWVNPKFEEAVVAAGGFIEWQDAGTLHISVN